MDEDRGQHLVPTTGQFFSIVKWGGRIVKGVVEMHPYIFSYVTFFLDYFISFMNNVSFLGYIFGWIVILMPSVSECLQSYSSLCYCNTHLTKKN